MKEIKLASICAGGLTTILLILAGLTSVLKIEIPSLVLGFVLAPFFIAFAVCIHYFFGKKTSLYSLLGIIFAVMYGVLICFNYYLQLTLMQKDIPGLDLFSMKNPNSIMWVIEVLGYFFMGLSTLVMAPILGTTVAEKVVKLAFILNGFLGIGGLIGYALNFPLGIMLVGLLLWNIIMPIGSGTLTYHFIKNSKPIE